MNKYFKISKRMLIEAEEEDSTNKVLQAAQDPNQDPKNLSRIGWDHFQNKDIVKAVGKNPNSSLHTIIRAAGNLGDNAHEIFDNPVLPLFAMENPSFLHTVGDEEGLRAIARNPHTPEYMQLSLANHPNENISTEIAIDLANNPNLSPGAALNLYNRDIKQDINNRSYVHDGTYHSEVHDALSQNPVIPKELHQEYLNKLKNPGSEDYELGQGILANPKTPLKIVHDHLSNTLYGSSLPDFWSDEDSRIRNVKFALKRPDLPPETIHSISDSGLTNWDVREGILTHPNTPTSVLDQHLENTWPSDNYVHNLIASHPNATPDILQKIKDVKAGKYFDQ